MQEEEKEEEWEEEQEEEEEEAISRKVSIQPMYSLTRPTKLF
jgi:hypothetical protein